MRRGRFILPMAAATAILSLATVSGSCGRSSSAPASTDSAATWPDTLRIGTLYSPAGYFIYRDEEMGYDYSMARKLCQDKGIAMSLHIGRSLADLVELLDKDSIDLIACEIPVTGDYTPRLIHCGPVNETCQVLVQPRSADRVTDVTQLSGHTVYVQPESKYFTRLQHLNDEIGGGIDIRTLDTDTLISSDLMDMVSDGRLPMTIVDSDIANVSGTYHPDLDVSVTVSLPQRSAWGVAPGRRWLADSIDAWMEDDAVRKANTEQLTRYYHLSKTAPSAVAVTFANGRISPYDEFFRKYAGQIGWDWRLLASIGWAESRFDPTLTSWAGARGIMQIMPVAARSLGIDPEAVADPETSIRAGAMIVRQLDRALAKDIPDVTERQKFILAAYNSGIAHIRDAIAIAGHVGLDKTRWHANVADALLMKSNPQYYNLECCRYGYFKGQQTYQFVDRVLDFYERCKRHVRQ